MSCRHAEMDHVGLGCSVLGCDCRGFEEGDEQPVPDAPRLYNDDD